MTSFTFANPAGFWALLGIPTVLLIHLLQQKTRRLPVSTLFLLQNLAPESIPGRSLQKLRKSVPLGLQLFMVVLLAWMLSEPRWLRPESAQTLVLVLDSSASMSAFRNDVGPALEVRFPAWEKGVTRTNWILLESDSKRPVLYRGSDRHKLLEALAHWRPDVGAHDWAPALELAQTARGGQGRIVVITDHEMELPAGVGLLALGRPLANVGFSGVVVEQKIGESKWRVTVQNYSDQVQNRTWKIESKGVEAPTQKLTLQPRQLRVLEGTFPAGIDRLELVLEPDDFTLDDRMPIVRPVPKPLTYSQLAGGETGSFFKRLAGGVQALTLATDPVPADLTVISRRLGQPVRESGNSILFYVRENAEGPMNLQPVVAEDHPLVRDLNWQGLLGGGPVLFEKTPEDRVLLWQGSQPLVLLREKDKAKILIFNFDFEHSNAVRLPAFVILINRFLEEVRSGKTEGWTDNFESNQPLKLVCDPALGAVEFSGPDGREERAPENASTWRAPGVPGFFSLAQGKNLLVSGAAHFGDPREADLSAAASMERLLEPSHETFLRNTEADPILPVWLLLAAAALVLSWWLQSALRPRTGGLP